MRRLKAMGFSRQRLAWLALEVRNLAAAWRGMRARVGPDPRRVTAMTGGVTEDEVRALRHRLGVRPVFKRIDTCAAEFEAKTPYMYSTYEAPRFGEPEDEARRPIAERSSSWAAGPTGSGRGSSSTIAAATPASRWRMPATRRSWSTATRRR